MKLIAHAVKNPLEAKKAIQFGCDFLEIDLSQNIFTGKFVLQHDALKGIMGIGKNPSSLLGTQLKEKLVIDLKAVKYSPSFSRKFSELIKPLKIKNLRLTSIDLRASSKIAQENNAEIYYGFLNKRSVDYFWQISKSLYKPAGFSIRKDLICEDLVKNLKTHYPKSEIWVWTVDDKNEMEKLEHLGVEAVVTDNWKI